MALSDLAFKHTFTPYRRLVILGQTIESNLIRSMSPLTAEIDFPKLTNFNVGNVSVTLVDTAGRFNPNNPDNFWADNWTRSGIPAHYNQVGFKGSLEVWIGYDREGTIESEKVFDGEVADITVNLNPPEVVVRAIDTSQSLRPTTIFDFGIERKVVLPEKSEARNFGEYPFPPQSVPADKSVDAMTTPGRDDMTDVGTIATEGTVDPLNYQVERNTIQTEGGLLTDSNKPEATFKDVYRYKRVDTLIKQLLSHYDVSNSEIEVLPQTTEAHFSSNGRPGWELENLPTDLADQWRLRGYTKDVVYDSTNKKYYMLYGQQSSAVPDRLISYDVATDTWERVATTNKIINSVRYEYEMWQLATDDFDTFYIMATVHGAEAGELRTYDSIEGDAIGRDSPIVILRYQISTGNWAIVDDWDGNRPLLGFHYSKLPAPADVRGATDRYPMLPDNRTSFVIKEISGVKQLVYRTAGGVRAYRLSDGTRSTLKTIPAGSRRSFDFWIGDTPATTFYAWIENTSNTTVLRVEDENGATILNRSFTNQANILISTEPDLALGSLRAILKSREGKVITISDLIYNNGFLYGVLQVTYGTGVASTDSAGVLIQIDVANNTLNLKKKYEDFLHAARSPVVHDGEVYYFEGSHYQYKTATPGELDYPNDTGHLIQVLEVAPTLILNPIVEDKGLCWRSKYRDPIAYEKDLGYGRHGGTASPMLSDGEALHLWAGYGDVEQSRYAPAENSENWFNQYPVNDVDNWNWLQYGTQITQRVPVFETNRQKAWEAITKLAALVNNTVSYRSGRFDFLPRLTKQTTLRSDLAETTTSLAAVVDVSRFPNSGLVLINDELIRYATKAADNEDIETLTRGVEGSQAAAHAAGDMVLFIDALAFNHTDKQNIAALDWKPDFTNIYNKLTAELTPIAGVEGEVVVENADSITANDERPRAFDFRLLSTHEGPWAKLMLSEYLTDMKQAQFGVELSLPWSPHLRVGQTLVIDQQVVAHLRWTPVRILRLSHDFRSKQTTVTARTFGERRISTPFGFSDTVEAHRIYVTGEAITPFTLPTASGGVGTITYTLSQLPTGMTYNAATREVAGTPSTAGTQIMTFTATDSSSVPQTAELKFRITVVNALAFDSNIPANVVFQSGCHIDYQLPAASGGLPSIRYRTEFLPDPLVFNANTRKITGRMPAGLTGISYSAQDKAGTTVPNNFNIIGDSIPQWRSLFVHEVTDGSDTFFETTAVDGASQTARSFKADGSRRYVSSGGTALDIALGDFTWRGATVTTNRKIFVAEDGTVKSYTLGNAEQTGEQLALGAGSWQDVALIGSRLGFLDRDTGAIRMYSTGRARQASADIVFGFDAQVRSIAADDTYVYVLIENSASILAWHIADAEFKFDAVIELPEGSNYQSITFHPDGQLLAIREKSDGAIAFDAGTRDRSKDVRLR